MPIPGEALVSMEKYALLNAVRHGGKAEVGPVMGKVLGEFPELRGDPDSTKETVKSVIHRVNSMAPTDQQAMLRTKYPEAEKPPEKEGRNVLPPLPNAVHGKTAFRLPPEPSGYMHIGHAMAFTLNYLYREMYGGDLWLRFEDTNPKKVAEEYYGSFRSGIEWLGIEFDHEKNVSDDMELMYEQGRRMIEGGFAYACSCDLERVKLLRFEGKPCAHRGRPVNESLGIWEELLARKHHEGTFVIRMMGDMTSLDYSLRDPNVFRVIEHPHPLTGDKYTLWPTYDLANTIEDEVCGITHVLRSSEFNTPLQHLIREKLGFRPVEVIQFSRYNFKGTPVSKRLLRPLVEEKLVSGWDDPRMPTIEGVRRRGILSESLRQFTIQVGYTKTEHEYDWSLLYAVNRKILDPVSKRLFFVPEPQPLFVEGAPDKVARIPNHPDKELGERNVATDGYFFLPTRDVNSLKKGDVFRLMDLYNVELVRAGAEPRGRYAGDELVHGSKKVQWVTRSHTDITILVAGLLFDDDGVYNDLSLEEVRGFAELATTGLKEGEIVQFPRFGFCRVDEPGTMIMAHK